MDCAELIGRREFLLDLFDLQYILTFSIEVMMMDYNKQNLLRIVSSELLLIWSNKTELSYIN